MIFNSVLQFTSYITIIFIYAMVCTLIESPTIILLIYIYSSISLIISPTKEAQEKNEARIGKPRETMELLYGGFLNA